MFIHMCGELLGRGWILTPVTFDDDGVSYQACRDSTEAHQQLTVITPRPKPSPVGQLPAGYTRLL